MTKKDIETAIKEFKKRLIERFGAETEIYLFGSVARRDYDMHSDIDLLVLLPFEPNNYIEEQVFDLGYDIELEYGVVFGIIVYSKTFWNSETAGVMPLYKNIKREGIGA
jgi:predicted nucleotidyltransferase